ncbi:F-box/kelch-repeat protein At1g57790-like [Pistacia vera]|uniref:F-box/kelch-repeat protein At1g57790-like n=1 Tax=Pistacia vera TaxID=55513 RepID=UPI001263E186|nr:F-box/kelch-repeat protein At1g57790-like [Pistacia vera]
MRAPSSWSDLPVDIQSVIMEHLYFDDQIRFRTVCKSWRWNTYAIKSADQLPWIFAYKYKQDDSGFCYLYNPSNKKKYEIKKKLPFGSRFHDSKYGWILISKPEENVSFHLACNLLYFYNPFTDETIKLSVLEDPHIEQHPLYIDSSQVIFSGNPTSNECVIFLHVANGWGLIRKIIYTCRPGDTRWTSHYCLEDFGRDILSLACVDGVLYCATVSRDGISEDKNFSLCSFQIIVKEQKIILDPVDVLSFAIPPWKMLYHCRLIESDGNVLLTYNYEYDESCVVFRVDFSEKKLVEIENLEKKMLFRGLEKWILASAVGAASELANTVHRNCFMEFDSCFYKAPETHLCPQPYGWIKEAYTSVYQSIWIQPPLHFTRYQKITPSVHSFMIGSIRVPIRIQLPPQSQ